MSEFDRSELFYAVERHIAENYAAKENSPPDEKPYIQEGDVEDVVMALEELGYKIVKA